ncbi:uncharacterized protein LOC119385126 isoform X3 [Rhipicephalus sanguineus]|uniref:uncharacterized protein LOC119385126 isoform X3 n=1 Tax=Rhipicephalus sanguineus TaxID=34632 RepID=UPI0020C29514|nr:uncharacterized protein LOC119385126 isoform X3 [Rhipicephalus sanguineus]
MRTALATVLLYLSSLPGPGSTTSNLFEVHEFLFMNKSILYLWKRRSNPKADRFCLCYGPSAAMSRHFGAFNCSASRRGALCHVRDSFAGCFGNAELAQASPQRRDAFVIPARLPSLPLAESTAGATIQCRLIDNTTADVLGDFPGNTNLTFCGVDVCRHCVGGFSNRTFCTSLWTRDPLLKFEPVAQSDFAVGVRWRGARAADQTFTAKVCASEGNCYMECFEEQVPGASGQFLVPTDLWRFRIAIYMRRHDGTTLYQKNFRSKRLAPDRPCFSTGVVKSWSEIWLYWWPQDDTSDGYVVSWCGGSDEGSHHAVTAVVAGATVAPAYENCSTDVSGSSIALRHLQAFTKYVFSMRAYRWLDANKTERLFSRPLKSQPIVLINPRAALTPLEQSTRAAAAAKKPHVPQTTAASTHRAEKAFPRGLRVTPWRLHPPQPVVIKKAPAEIYFNLITL